jgi:structural maintenance of chromosome 4
MFDLIKVLDEKILPAFYFTLRDTLVADDIVAANRIAFGGSRRWRTITLKGEVIETHGSMTGGGKSTKR